MTSKEFKAAGKAWKSARGLEQLEREQRAKAEREARYQRNLTLKAHGYTWRKSQDVFGPSDDGDYAGDTWTLYDPAGHAVSVSQALAAIAAEVK